ncbi:protein of unknown function [Mesotoga infera]|uniref:Uncharacterized protein n=1 Tax=Mesotoga infera TaxID=1236046 RepID=A0A7Z7LGW3_9BACT|nr:protein of unknown function [Mesotoga infera]
MIYNKKRQWAVSSAGRAIDS